MLSSVLCILSKDGNVTFFAPQYRKNILIESIHLHNFQCHKDLTLALGRSTVLQGGSDHGKTAVLRALYWVIYNEPQGAEFVSYWAQKPTKTGFKFKEGEYTEVSVVVDGHTIVRRRDNDFNGYTVDGVQYEALRGSVPEAVAALLNLSDVSVQKQMDAPFLLSMTSGEAAQFLNRLAGLEDVSGILAVAKKAGTDAVVAAEQAEANAKAAEEQEARFGWVDEVQRLADDCEKAKNGSLEIRSRLEAIGATVEDLDITLRELHPLERALKALPNPVDNAAAIKACQEGVAALRSYRDADQEDAAALAAFAQLDGLGTYPEDKDGSCPKLERLLVDYDGLEDLEKLADAERKLEALGPIVTAQQTPRAAMEKSLADYDSLEDVATIDNEIKTLETSIEGQVCPTCGRPYLLP